MKRIIKIAAAAFGTALLLFSSLSITASAEAVESGDYTYEVQGGDVVIVRYLGEDENIVVPATLDGKAVTVIGSKAFEMNPDFVTLELPDGVKKIEDHAFAIDRGLETITLPATLTEIGEQAFQQCEGLKEVKFAGDESAWKAIQIADGNELLTAITPSYNAELTKQEESTSSEAASSEAASSETVSSETVSSEASSSETVSSEAASSETVSSEAASAVDTSSSETATTGTVTESSSADAAPQPSKVNIPVVFGGILIGVAVLDIIYFSIKKPKD